MTDQDILGYLLKNLSKEESEKVMLWMKDPENGTELCRALGRIWDGAEITIKKGNPDFESMLGEVHQKMTSWKKARRSVPSRKYLQAFSRIASVFFLPLALISIYFFFRVSLSYPKIAENTIKEIHTKPGTRIRFVLEDSTVVWLNDGTYMKYPERFSKDERRVFVDGEAYFEVKKDTDRIFIVDNPLVQTVVTGTRFNLNAYSSDRYFEATLLDGNVQLFEDKKQYVLIPGQRFNFDQTTGEISFRRVDLHHSISWTKGELILQDELLSTAIKKIGRWYNMEVILMDEELKNLLITVTFKDEKPEQMLRLISMALPVEFHRKIIRNKDEIKDIFYVRKK
jgi:ferric-dicitrate binding protein FerR (iron transport regulator)